MFPQSRPTHATPVFDMHRLMHKRSSPWAHEVAPSPYDHQATVCWG